MAINVYMTIFKKYNSQQLKALEWWYHLLCYGGPFIIALSLLFVETSSRGRVYGPAVVSERKAVTETATTDLCSSGAGFLTNGTLCALRWCTLPHGINPPSECIVIVVLRKS